jgi:transposase
MYGPGRYVPDPTEGIVNIKDLPQPQWAFYHRDHPQTPCPRCGQLASRHKGDQRTLHDVGDLATGRPVDLLVSYSSHHCSRCQKYFNIDLADLAPPGSH